MIHGVILVKASSQTVATFVKEAKKVKGVSDAYPVFGRFDAVVFIEGVDFPDLKRIAGEVNSLGGVKSTETLAEGD